MYHAINYLQLNSLQSDFVTEYSDNGLLICF